MLCYSLEYCVSFVCESQTQQKKKNKTKIQVNRNIKDIKIFPCREDDCKDQFVLEKQRKNYKKTKKITEMKVREKELHMERKKRRENLLFNLKYKEKH